MHQTMICQTLRKETVWWQRQERSVLGLLAHSLATRAIAARATTTNKLSCSLHFVSALQNAFVFNKPSLQHLRRYELARQADILVRTDKTFTHGRPSFR